MNPTAAPLCALPSGGMNDSEFSDYRRKQWNIDRWKLAETFKQSLSPNTRADLCDRIDTQSQRYALGQVRQKWSLRPGRKIDPANGRAVALTMIGQSGVGKTLAACWLALQVIERQKTRLKPFFVSCRTLAMDVVDYDNQEAKDRWRNIREWAESRCFFILDDLGRERKSDAVIERLGFLLDARYRQFRPKDQQGGETVISTNLTLQEISARYGTDIKSRLMFREWMDIVPISAPDARVSR